MPRSRTFRGVLALVFSTVLLAGCASGPAGPLATVDGVEIPREQLEGWVRTATQANPDVNAVGIQGDLLSRVIQLRIVEGVLAERGLTVDPALVAEVRASIEEQVGGPLSLSATLADIGFPEEFFEEVFVPLEAAIDTLVLALAEGQGLETRTARHILVDTPEEADEVFALLADGADFAELAIERSQDPGSGARGGDLGPQARGSFVPPFDDAVWSAPLNTVLEPVESQFGFHVIEVTAIDVTSAADLSADQRRQLASAELESVLMGAIAAAEITIDPTIGVWDPMSGTIQPA